MHIENWDYWKSHVETIEGLSSLEKERVKNAFDTVGKIFDTDLQSLVEKGHYIYWNIANTAPWTRKWFIHFSDALQKSLSQKNGQQIIDRLKRPSDYDVALLELDIANSFMNVGFEVEFYPIVEQINKKPDLKITNPNTNEQFFVEITELGASDQAKESYKTFDTISKELFSKSHTSDGKRIHSMGRIHKYLSEPNLKRIMEKINNMIEKVKNTGFEELVENEVIELALSTDDKIEFLKSWAKERGIDANLIGPSSDPDEVHRLHQKIRREQKQLPQNLLNILVIKDGTRFMIGRRDIKEVSKLEEYVYEHNHLAFCIVFNSYISGSLEEKIMNLGDHIRLQKSSDMLGREMLILTNKFIIDKTLTPNSISKIKQAFLENREFLV